MILDSPCKLYLKALLVQGWTVQRVEEHAHELGLDYVSIQFLVYLAENAVPPEVFRPKDKNHAPSQEFLKTQALEGLVPTFCPPAQAAFHLLQKPKAREVLEVLGVAQASTQDMLRALADVRVRTSLEAVEWFVRLFWNVREMDGVQLRAILQLRNGTVEVPATLMALQPAQTPTDLPAPHQQSPTTPAGRERARERRASGNQGLHRELVQSQDPIQAFREAQALRRASWSDPRLALASMPPSPLTVSLGRALAGIPLSRLDLSKAYEVLLVMATQRIATSLHDTHPEASTRFAQYTSGALNLLKLQKEIGGGEASLRSQLQAITLQSRSPGVYGEPEKVLPEGSYQISPYTKQDQETAREMMGGKRPEPEKKVPAEEKA